VKNDLCSRNKSELEALKNFNGGSPKSLKINNDPRLDKNLKNRIDIIYSH